MARTKKTVGRRKRPTARPKAKAKRSPLLSNAELTHIDPRGQARMVDVSAKNATERLAIAEGRVIMRKETLDLVLAGNALKGDVLGAARLAGIMAAKRTHGLIPLCHPLPITKIEIEIDPEHALPGFLVRATVKVTGPDRRRDGGVGRGIDRVPDHLRHGQGGGTRHAHRGHKTAAQKRRQIRRLSRRGLHRMSGPLMPVAEALQRVLADARALPAETVALDEALGRVLTQDLNALRTQPPAAVSAMDGYAVRAADVAQAPVNLRLIGEVAAGHPFDGEVKAGQAARIFTGGVMPGGADTVVIQELTARDGDTVTIQKATAKGRNVRGKGIDFTQGQPLLQKGHRLSDRDLMLAAAMNFPDFKRAPTPEGGGARHRRRAGGARNQAQRSARSSIPTDLPSSPWRVAKAPR